MQPKPVSQTLLTVVYVAFSTFTDENFHKLFVLKSSNYPIKFGEILSTLSSCYVLITVFMEVFKTSLYLKCLRFEGD